jgi:hypothetical protein
MVFGNEAVKGCRRLVLHPPMVVVPRRGSRTVDCHETFDGPQLATDKLYGFGMLASSEEQLRAGIVDHIAPLRRGEAVVEMDGNNAYLGGGEV